MCILRRKLNEGSRLVVVQLRMSAELRRKALNYAEKHDCMLAAAGTVQGQSGWCHDYILHTTLHTHCAQTAYSLRVNCTGYSRYINDATHEWCKYLIDKYGTWNEGQYRLVLYCSHAQHGVTI